MTIDKASGQVLYRRKRDRGLGMTQIFDALDILARILASTFGSLVTYSDLRNLYGSTHVQI